VPETGRNAICYGNASITVESRVGDVVFAEVGDIADVAQIQAVTLAPYSAQEATWGVALMRLQANLPDSLPGQNVTIVALGDVALTNSVANAGATLDVTMTANGRMRSTPTTASNANVLTSVPSGTTLEAIGRDATGTWVYTDYAGTVGWISTQVLNVPGDVNSLSLLPDEPVFRAPMQAFTLSTGIGQAECEALPLDGILLQSPTDAGQVSLTINGVDIAMGSTLFINTQDNTLQVFVLEGIAIVGALDAQQIVPAGTFVTVPLDETGTAPADVPSAPQPYDNDQLANLPVGALDNATSDSPTVTVLPEAVAISAPLPQEDIEETISTYVAGLGLEAGTYTITRVQAVLRGNSQSICPPDATFTRTHDGSADVLFGEYRRLPDGRFGANDADLDVARNPDPAYIGEANQISLTSPTSFRWFAVSNGNGDSAYCEFVYTGVKTSP
jgi:hypothetical protein